jgi:hypothetical protein
MLLIAPGYKYSAERYKMHMACLAQEQIKKRLCYS